MLIKAHREWIAGSSPNITNPWEQPWSVRIIIVTWTQNAALEIWFSNCSCQRLGLSCWLPHWNKEPGSFKVHCQLRQLTRPHQIASLFSCCWSWREGSGVKRTFCWYRGPELSSQCWAKWFKTAYNSSSKRYNTLFCPPWTLHSCVHITRHI